MGVDQPWPARSTQKILSQTRRSRSCRSRASRAAICSGESLMFMSWAWSPAGMKSSSFNNHGYNTYITISYLLSVVFYIIDRQTPKWRQMVVHSSIVMLTVIVMLLNVALVAWKNIVASPHVTTRRRGIIWQWLNWAVSDCFTKDYAIKGHNLTLQFPLIQLNPSGRL